jgi:hypothetical protein
MSESPVHPSGPTVSVIVPLYNKARYILETVESVQRQTVDNWELIVVDNLSTDEGPSIIRSLSDPRIRLISCDRPGVSAARNAGLEAAAGEWLVFLDADDLLNSGYMESQLKAARASAADLVICSYEEFRDGTSGPGVIKAPVHGAFSAQKLRDSSIVYCPGPQHMFMAKRSLIEGGPRWSETLDKLLGEDTCFWFQAIKRGKIAFNPAAPARYRIWAPDSRFTNLSDPERLFHGISEAVKHNLAFLEAESHQLTSGQAEMLMRFYCEVYLKAKASQNSELAEQAMADAQRWLSAYFALAKRPLVSMIVRRLLGLRLFAALFHRRHFPIHASTI